MASVKQLIVLVMWTTYAFPGFNIDENSPNLSQNALPTQTPINGMANQVYIYTNTVSIIIDWQFAAVIIRCKRVSSKHLVVCNCVRAL